MNLPKVEHIFGGLIVIFVVLIIINDRRSSLPAGSNSQSNFSTSEIKIKYTKKNLNVREKPNAESKVVKTLMPNEKVRTKEIEENGFTQILNSENLIYGWCSSKYLQNMPLSANELHKPIKLIKEAKYYVRLISDSVKIKYAPNPNSSTVAIGMKNEMFDLDKMEGGWYVIFMFSGMYRYLNISCAIKVDSIQPYSFPIEVKKQAYIELYEAEGKSMEDAYLKFPNEALKQADYVSVLDDKYKLLIFRKYSIPTPYSNKLNFEGSINKWSTK